MLIIREKEMMMKYADSAMAAAESIGFVPTMGALHQGHISLIDRSRAENDRTVLSVFVNRRQFNNAQDFDKYPRTMAEDLMMADAAGVDVVFVPNEDNLYSGNTQHHASLDGLDNVWEGAFRPGHFNGVLEVVWQLFTAVKPDRAYFGEKDFQQVLVVKRLIASDFPRIKLVEAPTWREPDGLAMSSRNVRLSPNGRSVAPHIFNSMSELKRQLGNAGNSSTLIASAIAELKERGIETEYLAIVHAENLAMAENYEPNNGQFRLIFAGYIDGVRLIDNIAL